MAIFRLNEKIEYEKVPINFSKLKGSLSAIDLLVVKDIVDNKGDLLEKAPKGKSDTAVAVWMMVANQASSNPAHSPNRLNPNKKFANKMTDAEFARFRNIAHIVRDVAIPNV